MPRTYRGSINIDYTRQETGPYQRLIAALIRSGWIYVETSALIIESQDLADVWRGVELVAKQCARAGELSAFTFHIQSSENFAGIPYRTAAMNLRDPAGDIDELPWPRPGE